MKGWVSFLFFGREAKEGRGGELVGGGWGVREEGYQGVDFSNSRELFCFYSF